MYNQWFLDFSPQTFLKTRVTATKIVEDSLKATNYLRNISPAIFKAYPGILSTLRMSTCPPIAVDRLIGLSGVTPSLVKGMELEQRLPLRMNRDQLDQELGQIGAIIERMADPEIFSWLRSGLEPTEREVHRAATIIADRLCAAQANPIIRNEQEKRQLLEIKKWLEARGYTEVQLGDRVDFRSMQNGTFSFRLNVVVGDANPVNIPVDAVIMPRNAQPGQFPLLVEAKSAGDFTNTNKRRKEEATKMIQLRGKYGAKIKFILFLCGYFGTSYLKYEADEGIDWVWEHRIDDLAGFGL
ncbi:XamI family restriction endonuclease [Ectopseudomonas hydrolytica]|uniref:XamI family restriction endonuclease n=1 Tax=Ectopseudomonas hydrolytica TaxID=2493633 RepID=A0ABY5A1V2_9GAMM|nr:XamI family restriction endonuclease [Pseudomonas hydrolytica]USR37867.1 XamI family restriction endonuclease [Pseudomonas hydrolytica]